MNNTLNISNAVKKYTFTCHVPDRCIPVIKYNSVLSKFIAVQLNVTETLKV